MGQKAGLFLRVDHLVLSLQELVEDIAVSDST